MTDNSLKTSYGLNYSEPVQAVILELVKKYQLELDPNLTLAERVKKKNPKVFFFKLAKKILAREGSFKDIVETLRKEFGLDQVKAEALAHEIKDKVVVLAEEVLGVEPEEEETEDEIEPAAQTQDYSKELAKHIKEQQVKPKPQPITPKPPAPTPAAPKKSVETSIEKPEEPKKVKTVIPPEVNKTNPGDTYREPIE